MQILTEYIQNKISVEKFRSRSFINVVTSVQKRTTTIPPPKPVAPISGFFKLNQ